MNQKLLFILPCLLGLVLIATPVASHAQTVPAGMTYQGRLTDSNGVASPDGTGYEIEVRLWTTATGGTTPLWGARYTGVAVRSGAFNLVVGGPGGGTLNGAIADLMTVFNTAPVTYIGLTVVRNAAGAVVPNPTEILPRQQLLSAPYAIRAQNAYVANTVDPNSILSSSIKDAEVKSGDIGVGEVKTTNLADQSVTAAKIANGAITQAQIGRINLPPPDYDSGWADITAGQTQKKILGFTGLPSLVTAYYKLPTGEVLPWGLNQYGDAGQGNGIILDCDEVGNLYVRTPSGNSGNNALIHLGTYRNRTNNGNVTIVDITTLQFRVRAWK